MRSFANRRRVAGMAAFAAPCPPLVAALREQSQAAGEGAGAASVAPIVARLSRVRAECPTWNTAFAETLNDDQLEELQATLKRRSFHNAQTAGLVVAVGDDMDVAGCSSRYGVNSSLVHNSPGKDHPIVECLRGRGSTILGKVRCSSPFALTEALNFDACPAGLAVHSGACDVVVTTSLMGVAGSNACTVYPVVSFAPSSGALPRGTPRFSRYRSQGLVFRDVEALCSAWEGLTASGAATKEATLTEAAEVHDPRHEGGKAALSPWSALAAWLPSVNRAQPATTVSQKRSAEAGGIVVGVAEDWLESCFSTTQPGTGRSFLDAIVKAMASRNEVRKLRHNRTARPFEVRELSWNANPNEVLACAATIAQYELAEKLKAEHMDGSGLLDQLPAGVVNAIFNGKNTSQVAYLDALAFRSELSREYTDEAAEVDCVISPILTPPHTTHNARSVLASLPVALSRSPSVSMRMALPHFAVSENDPGVVRVPGSDTDIAVMISGEPGMDTRLIETVYELTRDS